MRLPQMAPGLNFRPSHPMHFVPFYCFDVLSFPRYSLPGHTEQPSRTLPKSKPSLNPIQSEAAVAPDARTRAVFATRAARARSSLGGRTFPLFVHLHG